METFAKLNMFIFLKLNNKYRLIGFHGQHCYMELCSPDLMAMVMVEIISASRFDVDCLQNQQGVLPDLHPFHSPGRGVYISKSECRGHTGLGCVLPGGAEEAIQVCDSTAGL